MRGSSGVGAKRQRLANKQKRGAGSNKQGNATGGGAGGTAVGEDESTVDYVVDTFDLSRPINIDTDICAMCKQNHHFGVLMQRIMPSISDMGLDHINGEIPEDELYMALIGEGGIENEERVGEDEEMLKKKEHATAATSKSNRNTAANKKQRSNNGTSGSSSSCSTLKENGSLTPLDPENIWISRYSFQSRRCFVHFYCALYSPRTWFTGVKWHNVMKEVSRSACLTCSYCKQRGASMGCYEPRCNVVMHFPCAVKNGYRIYRYARSFYCTEHSNRKRYEDRGLVQIDHSTKSDLSLGKEPIPVSIVDGSLVSSHDFKGNAYNGPDFKYVNMNVDSDAVISNSRNVDGLACCRCEDLCDDPDECDCLNQGRNYTYQGMLFNPFAKTKLLECNIKCRCSYRRCTNRVVEKGLTFQLEIFRLPLFKNQSKYPVVKYGVRTLNAIPQYSFVCQVNGQFVSVPNNQGSSTNEVENGVIRMSTWEDDTEVDVQLFADDICLDCRKFGNVGAFIRRRPADTTPMLIRKLVYNSTNVGALPKLALFAARNIEANTELLL